MINGLDFQGAATINAVGQDVLSQKELFGYFNDGKFVFFVHIPFEAAESLSRFSPFGRFRPFAVEALKILDTDPEKNKPIKDDLFNKILGKEPRGIREFYNKENGKLVGRKSPLGKHTIQIVSKMVSEPAEGYKLSMDMFKSIKGVYFTMLKNK